MSKEYVYANMRRMALFLRFWQLGPLSLVLPFSRTPLHRDAFEVESQLSLLPTGTYQQNVDLARKESWLSDGRPGDRRRLGMNARA